MTTLSKVINFNDMTKITSEFSRLGDKCYLDNSGTALYPQCLMQTINNEFINSVYMNPHTDKYTTDCIEQIRCLVLKHFNTDPSTYTIVFTSGSTHALKLVAESFQFTSSKRKEVDSGSFVYLRDNHTSVIGMREIARDKRANIINLSHEEFYNLINPADKIINDKEQLSNKENKGNALFVYPAQTNFNGHKYPLDCIPQIKDGVLNNQPKIDPSATNRNWYVMLDAASFVGTNILDLSETQPDFLCLSFYKIFGYPTGLGALLIKNSSAHALSDLKYFGGGSVEIVLGSEDYHVKRQNLSERFEAGTPAFLSILALKHCFNIMNKLIPKVVSENVMDTISHHTFYLAKDLYSQLKKLKHKNSNPAAVLYMDSDFTDITKQGGIVTFNLLREDGSFIGYAEFHHIADLYNINVRTGCFCNSSSCQRHLNITNEEMKEMYKAGHKCGDDLDLIDGKPTGAVRVSFSYYNTFNDVDKLMNLISRCFVKIPFKPKQRKMNDYYNKSQKCTYLCPSILEKTDKHNDVKTMKIKPYPKKDNGILQDISIFPIKSCAAFKIKSSWKIGPKGFDYDREFMIVNFNGVCLTQKQCTKMCLICPEIDLARKLLILHFKGKYPISVSLKPQPEDEYKEAKLCQTKVCTDFVEGIDCGDNVADWISEALEISFLRLIRQSDSDRKSQRKNNDKKKTLLNLSNQAQFLLINRSTVQWLKKIIQDPLFIDDIDDLTDRFRGNLIVEMKRELVEREWDRVIIGIHEFKVEGQCPRCQMICIDQKTGDKTVEPLRTIAEQFAGKLRFGIYLTYIGTIDGSKQDVLKNYSQVEPRFVEKGENDF